MKFAYVGGETLPVEMPVPVGRVGNRGKVVNSVGEMSLVQEEDGEVG